MTKRTLIIGGNWKMNTDLESGMQLAGNVADGIAACDACEVVIYPPFPFLQAIDSVVDQSHLVGPIRVHHEYLAIFTTLSRRENDSVAVRRP